MAAAAAARTTGGAAVSALHFPSSSSWCSPLCAPQPRRRRSAWSCSTGTCGQAQPRPLTCRCPTLARAGPTCVRRYGVEPRCLGASAAPVARALRRSTRKRRHSDLPRHAAAHACPCRNTPPPPACLLQGALGEPEAMTPMTPKSASSASSDSTGAEQERGRGSATCVLLTWCAVAAQERGRGQRSMGMRTGLHPC